MKSANKNISEILKDKSAVERAFRKGIAYALWRHKRLGESISVWQDGRVVRLTGDEIPDLPLDGGPVQPETETGG
ncbi:MAG: hypothetical protein ABS79_05850 [Planctomycetes bacterium SCN 63-9]|nr:MAG: hypothetical protein ABS79_05850 [Planctomycetes bacterium SCN 63-9]